MFIRVVCAWPRSNTSSRQRLIGAADAFDGQQIADNAQHAADSRQQTSDSRLQIADSRLQIADSRQCLIDEADAHSRAERRIIPSLVDDIICSWPRFPI
jgi:hypothetical protein